MANPITPETRVHLLNVPLENNMKNTLWFANENAQRTYFLSKIVKSNVDFTYQRKDKIMKVPYLVDTIYTCNYIMYQNHNFTDKWFYAFITKMEYVDEETTRLYIDTDPIQTWFFEMEVKQCFVEREHAKVDKIGSNLQPEDLELGDYIVNSDYTDHHLTQTEIVLASSKAPWPDLPDRYGQLYNGIFTAYRYYSWSDYLDAREGINRLSATPEAILSVFMAPSFLTNPKVGQTEEVQYSEDPYAYQLEADTISSLDGLTPHNKKLLTYPYCFIKVSNLQGQTGVYKQELFKNLPIRFNVAGVLTPGCSIRLTPVNYNGVGYNNEEGINLGKYPICGWSTDSYTNWLTQNGLPNTISTLGGAGALIGGLSSIGTSGLSALGVGAIAGGITAITNSLHQRYVAELQPPQVGGNINCGDVMTASQLNTFHFYYMTIKYQFARVIDKYFDMFGYKTNLVKVPETNHRKNWWYIKTIDANIVGDIPEEDMQRIRDCYNQGITYWKNPANMYNYDVDNSII